VAGHARHALLPDQAEDQVLGHHAPAGQALEPDAQRLRAPLRERLRGQHVLDLAGADAEREGPERAVRGGVRVAADDRHPRLRDAELGADHVHDPLPPVPEAVVGDAELLAVAPQRLELDARELVLDAALEPDRGDVVVGGGEGAVGAADGAAGDPQAVERLRAGDLVDEVEIDEQEVVADHVVVPDLLERGLGH
jgi:hypothetical protein